MAIAYPAVVAVGVNLLLLPADPEPLLRQEGAARLRAARTAKLLLVQRLVESAALVGDLAVEPSPEERARLASLAVECERFAAAVSTGVRPMPAPPANGGDSDAR